MTRENLKRAKNYADSMSYDVAHRALNAVVEVIDHLIDNDLEMSTHIIVGPPDYMGMVREFHEMTGQNRPEYPSMFTAIDQVSRLRLISEEFGELVKAMDQHDIVATADALADLLYVVFGTAVAFGLPMDEIFRQVHASNMTKKGGHMEGGKWIKPKTYKPVDLSWVKNWKPGESK